VNDGAVSAAPGERCPNCGRELGDPRPRYCGYCGQETSLRPPRFFEFVQQFGGAYFSTEGALWRTLALLLFRPGELTRRYLTGRRKHYVLPLRLYITVSLLALLAIRLITPPQVELGADVIAASPRERLNITVLTFGEGSAAGVKDGKFYCTGLPPWFCTRLEAKLDVDPKQFARDLRRLPERFIAHWGTAMVLLLPYFALLHKLLYWGRGLRYAEHLVHALHVHSFWFVAVLLALLPWSWVGIAMAVVVPLYTLQAARRVYGGGWFGTLWRAAVVALLYLAVIGIAVGLVMIWAFLS
jgi:Protein of unknown function (DUF3667)